MSKNILIVEDDKTTSFILQKHIENLKYNVSSIATTTDEAIKIINKKIPDIALVDITLQSNMDGIEVGNYINDNIDIPFVYVTAHSDSKTMNKAKISNPFGYIIKPIDRRELKASIDMAFLRFEMEKTLKSNELKLSTILNSIADAVIVADSSGEINYMNPTAEAMTESSYKNEEGKSLKAIVRIENDIIESLKNKKANNKNSFSIQSDEGNNYLISKNGKRVPVDYSITPQKDGNNNLIGTVMVLRDMTVRVEYEERLKQSFGELRMAMSGMIEAMAQTVETKDPYTAGHQKRVADIARHVAEKIGLEHDRIEGVRMAGVIHDLGKISVPSEILTKPGRITDIEFNIIKRHSQTGYEILKNIEFPWPIAKIVHQHHERLDGSGYPLGLSGDEILIEANIIAVADVVEAMGFHRPYRAALGIEIALEEISKNKNKYFWPDIVDACVELFAKDGYKME